MWKFPWIRALALAVSFNFSVLASDALLPSKQLPPVLEGWRDWVLWNENVSPPLFSDAANKIAVWPSRMVFNASGQGATFSLTARVFQGSRVLLPGGMVHWPTGVTTNGQLVPVTPQDGRPSIWLEPGIWSIQGNFIWAAMPQQVPIPSGIGLLTLTVNGVEMPFPAWDASGQLWLRRDRVTDEADKDFLSVQVYRVIDDGIPMWLRSEIELSVSGKNREEEIGAILPAGWKLASVDAPIPVFIDQNGEMKAQVRPGRWVVKVDAFRLDSPEEVAYPADVTPAVSDELIAFRSRPDLRLVEVTGIPAVDVSQTTFPEQWRDLPVYRWETDKPFGLVERQRGTGLQQLAGLTISRRFWLNENGEGFTFQDRITGSRQEIWRLDAAPGQQPGSIQTNGEGQLITRNPETGAPGVEIRSRDLNVVATGRMDETSGFSATGWQTSAENLHAAMMLPPGWRLFAMFGPDEVDGEWLSSWSLLDLFLLLIFSVAVFKMWGVPAGILAFVAFTASYHEPGAPHFLWLALLPPLALLRVVTAGPGRRFIQMWKWLTVLALAFSLIPFLSQQVQQLIYPQLEEQDQRMGFGNEFGDMSAFVVEEAMPVAAPATAREPEADSAMSSFGMVKRGRQPDTSSNSNLAYAAGARIQTGPGVPEWEWRNITMRWNGPVQEDQVINPILISRGMERIITLFRIIFLLALAALLLDVRQLTTLIAARKTVKIVAIFAAILTLAAPPAQAQFPDEALLQTLRERLLLPIHAFPDAADIASTMLRIQGNRITVTSQIHAGAECAVPLPGRLPSWSPVNVLIDGVPADAVVRRDGFLWIALSQGVHEVTVEGMLPEAPDWEWTFLLKPRRILVEAPDWNITGINADGVPESQVFLSRKQKADASEASYDRQDVDAVAIVERQFEMGLVWQLRTTVRRLSPRGRAIELRVPLVPGERILSANLVVDGDRAEVRLGGNEDAVSWSSELPVTETIPLTSREDDTWVERWTLIASPVWNFTFSGIVPVFETSNPNLVPVWSPWPGESVTWKITRPEAELGATLTIDRVQHSVSIGSRQRTGDLTLALRSSLGEEFAITLPEAAEVTALTHDDKSIPVRIDNGRLLLPLKPGAQNLNLHWRINTDAGFNVQTDAIRLPVESANVQTTMQVGNDRWVLWTYGPLRGPAVRFWIVLVVAMTAGWILGSVPGSPLKHHQWMLLSLGLTQVPLMAAVLVAGWFFIFVWRGTTAFTRLPAAGHNIIQILTIIFTAVVMLIFIWIVGEGLLGSPEMFILGNGSGGNFLQWYEAHCPDLLSQPGYLSVSIWWYRLLMLLWALWLAASLLRWLWWAWGAFAKDGVFRFKSKKPGLPK